MLTELLKRPYIAVGMLAFLILSAMGITSNTWMMRKLGKRWKRLHKTVYIAAPLICLHFIWTVRSDYGEAIFYTGIFVILLGFRLWKWQSAQKRSSGFAGDAFTGMRQILNAKRASKAPSYKPCVLQS